MRNYKNIVLFVKAVIMMFILLNVPEEMNATNLTNNININELPIEQINIIAEPKKDTKTSVINDEVSYINTQKVSNKSEKIPKKTNVNKETLINRINRDNKRQGTSGRLYFSSFYSVALYNASMYDHKIQGIVDAKDSAAYFDYKGVMVIGDHARQGFDIIKKQRINDKIYIKYGKNIRTYTVSEKVDGINTGTKLMTTGGREVNTIDASLILYTCNSTDGKKVTILILK